MLRAIGLIACAVAAAIPASRCAAAPFMAGADISSLPVLEDAGAVYRDGGVAGDAVDILRAHGTNYFRLRLFVDPSGSNDPFVVQDLAYTIDLAKRVKASGAKLLLDFHYSDTWADPGKQFKPSAWNNLDATQLRQQVYDYTKASIEAFKAEGVLPEMVQIGNEISNGMLWNSASPAANNGYVWTGGSHNTGFDRLAALLEAGIDGAKDGAGPGQEPLIMIHHDKGAQWSTTQFYFDKLVARELDFDVIGYSYYPKFHYTPATGAGDIDDVATNLTNTANKYGKPVVLVETGFPSRNPSSSEQNLEFPVTPAGQQAYLQSLVSAVQNVPNDLGWGVFWWYAEARPTPGLSVWEGGRYGLFDQNGNLLPAASVYEQFLPAPGDFNADGLVDAADYTLWRDRFGSQYDESDYADWLANFHAAGSAAATSYAANVPEPASIVFIMLSAALAGGRLRPCSACRRSRAACRIRSALCNG